MTFKELFQAGQCSISAIDAWVEIWHKGKDIRQSLQTFLGLTDEEYQIWLTRGNAGLAQTLNSGHMPEYETVYLSWDELTAQIQEIVDSELGPGNTVTLRRQDYYYWDIHKMAVALKHTILRIYLRRVDNFVGLFHDFIIGHFVRWSPPIRLRYTRQNQNQFYLGIFFLQP